MERALCVRADNNAWQFAPSCTTPLVSLEVQQHRSSGEVAEAGGSCAIVPGRAESGAAGRPDAAPPGPRSARTATARAPCRTGPFRARVFAPERSADPSALPERPSLLQARPPLRRRAPRNPQHETARETLPWWLVQVWKLSFGLQQNGVGTPKHWWHRSMAAEARPCER